jgi:hypothetical protein
MPLCGEQRAVHRLAETGQDGDARGDELVPEGEIGRSEVLSARAAGDDGDGELGPTGGELELGRRSAGAANREALPGCGITGGGERDAQLLDEDCYQGCPVEPTLGCGAGQRVRCHHCLCPVGDEKRVTVGLRQAHDRGSFQLVAEAAVSQPARPFKRIAVPQGQMGRPAAIHLAVTRTV